MIKKHSLPHHGKEVINSMHHWAKLNLLSHLKPVHKCWQPSDYLPDASSKYFVDAVQELQKKSKNLPSEYLVTLVGNTVTEEAVPTYMNMLNLNDEIRDETGVEDHPWAIWTRSWTAEENRHGDVLNKYLYLTGRVNMRQVDASIQNLIKNGMNSRMENNPYMCFVYTSFQERATKISHSNIASKAKMFGDDMLYKICTSIAHDEARHEVAYTEIVDELFKLDPDGTMVSFANMMRNGIVMPSYLVSDDIHEEKNNGRTLFADYASVAEESGIYTTRDYADILEFLIKRWNIENIHVISHDACISREYLINHLNRIRKLDENKKKKFKKNLVFSWIL
jgi:acyl-[acyl-carrier-protein] desaturase